VLLGRPHSDACREAQKVNTVETKDKPEYNIDQSNGTHHVVVTSDADILLRNPTGADEDLHLLLNVEQKGWCDDGENLSATIDKIRSRVAAFPRGVTIATAGGSAAGSQYAFQFQWDGNPESLTSWEELTNSGCYWERHQPDGNTGFLVGVGVVPDCCGIRYTHAERWSEPLKASELLIARTLDVLFSQGCERVIANARVPFYHKRPDLTVEEYCSLRRADDCTLFDPVLRFHERMGARIFKPVGYSMHDPESRDAGCWVMYEKRFEGMSGTSVVNWTAADAAERLNQETPEPSGCLSPKEPDAHAMHAMQQFEFPVLLGHPLSDACREAQRL
jgi:hypothetical protein